MTEDAERVSSADVVRMYERGRRDFRGVEVSDDGGTPALRGAILEGADFGGSFIVADFSRAFLRGSSFRLANVKTCRFDQADLSNADFRGAAIDAATFTDAVLEGADFEGAGWFGIALGKRERRRS